MQTGFDDGFIGFYNGIKFFKVFSSIKWVDGSFLKKTKRMSLMYWSKSKLVFFITELAS